MTPFFALLCIALPLVLICILFDLKQDGKDLFDESQLYAYFGYTIFVTGIICGIACGFLYKMPILEYKYPYSKTGDLITTYVFNTPLMFYIWLSAVALSLSFGAVSAHLKNQNRIIALLKKDSQKIGQTEQPEQKEQSEQQNSAEQKRSPAE